MQDLPTRSLTELPLILAGPILRRTTPVSVTVWVALREACEVNLQIFATEDGGQKIGNSLLSGSRATVAIGQHLHIVAVTADRGQPLQPDRVYAYDLTLTAIGDGSAHPIPLLTLQQAMSAPNTPPPKISYFDHQYPTFVLPASQLADLQIVHGSCRKPHGDGCDALTILDTLLAASATQPAQRPQQLLLTGDQIYGDDVAAPLLWVATHLSAMLLGWKEQLPVSQGRSSREYRPVNEFTIGNRAEIATRQGGFTAGLQGRERKVCNHLFSLGEYYVVYLLSWSPVCWPSNFPSGKKWANRDRQAAKQWDREVGHLKQFVDGLDKVRRALANIPLYTIFDDHDVSDDWNLNQAWCLRVLGKPLGKHVVQNALLAYAIFQGWGNTPDQFSAGRSGVQLLAAAEKWAASGGTDASTDREISRLVGMPSNDPLTGLPIFVSDGEVSILDRDPDALTWHYQIESNCHHILVLDTRTWRGYHLNSSADRVNNRSPIDPPMLLSPTGFDRQLIQPLQSSAAQELNRFTLIVAPTNLFSLEIIDWFHQISLRRKRVFAADVGDAWNIHTPALAQLLTTLFVHLDTVVVLSGDIHYGAVVRLSHRQINPTSSSSVLVQLTASAIKNEEVSTKLLHTRLKDLLLPEKIRHSIGWNHPPQMLPFQPNHSRHILNQPHDWECRLEWIPRSSRVVVSENRDLSLLVSRRSTWLNRWCQQLKWWKNPWFQDGREVVGLNNLAVIRWQFGEIVQDQYWFSPWQPTQIVLSRFTAPLVPSRMDTSRRT